METYHLSHTDLDGYTCQYIASRYLNNIFFFNANYGAEVLAKLEEIISRISGSDAKKFLILITDLNLNVDEGRFLQKEVEILKESGKDVAIQLLDHHGSGKDCAQQFEWYFLDTTKSATKITWEHFAKNYTPKSKTEIEKMARLIDAVNAIDIWLENEELFEFGKVCMRMINNSNELGRVIFDNENREYKFGLLKKAIPFVSKIGGHIKLDDSLHRIKKRLLSEERKNDIIDNIISKKVVDLLSKNKDRYSIYYQGKLGILTYGLGSISTIANQFLKENGEFFFFIDIGPKGHCSLRASGKFDVSVMSKELFNGGGHPNASGGKIEGFKESFLYDEVKSKLTEIIKNRGYKNGETGE